MNLEQTPFRSIRELYQTPAVFPASVYAYPGVTQIFYESVPSRENDAGFCLLLAAGRGLAGASGSRDRSDPRRGRDRSCRLGYALEQEGVCGDFHGYLRIHSLLGTESMLLTVAVARVRRSPRMGMLRGGGDSSGRAVAVPCGFRGDSRTLLPAFAARGGFFPHRRDGHLLGGSPDLHGRRT